MFTGGILECVLGNTFSFIVFASYGKLPLLPPSVVSTYLIANITFSYPRWVLALRWNNPHTFIQRLQCLQREFGSGCT